ncbi:MAG TPA: hypothetical protein VF121_06250 [Thermoanaerobaculia bacterium]|nr:hypothetical protein [Thermoanaerobaculia bacterium]
MLAALLVSALVVLVAYLYGWGALAVWARISGQPWGTSGASLPLPITALAGLVVLAAGSGVWALFDGLGAAAFFALLACAAVIAVLRRHALGPGLRREAAELRAAGPLGWLLLAAGVLFVLARTAGPVESYDAGSYHAPLIRWLETYGFVPGLGNLHGRLALSAGWLVPSALFSFAWLGGRSLHLLNGTLLLLLLLWGATALGAWRRGERRASVLLRLLLPLLGLRFFGNWLSSPSPDVAAAALVWIAGVLGLELTEGAEDERAETGDRRAAALALLAGFAVAVKLSVLPIVLLPLFLAGAGIARGQPRRAAALAAALALPLAPAIAQSVVTSGYPLFPLPWIDPFELDWEVPRARVEGYVDWIRSWALLPNRPQEEALAMPFQEWLALWWEHLRWPFSGAVLAILLLAPLRLLLVTMRRLTGRPSLPRVACERVALHLTVWAGALFWFLTAPAPRFGWGFAVLLALLLALPLLATTVRRLPAAALAALLLAALAWEAWQVHGWEPEAFPDAARHARLPADYPRPSTRRVVLGGIAVQVPIENDQCWYEPFPCTPTPDPRLTPRGADLADGFRVRPELSASASGHD